MEKVKASTKTISLVNSLNPLFAEHSEMAPSEQLFLVEMVLQAKPKKILEVGVAAGASSVLILQAIKDLEGTHLYSVDYNTDYYRIPTKKTGFIVDEYPELQAKHTLYTSGLVSNHIEKIGKDIDVCFIDTMHSIPGEILDFLLVLPYLRDDALVIFHDTNLHTCHHPVCNVNNLLMSSIRGKKFIPDFFEPNFYHNLEKRIYTNFFENIGAIRLDGKQKEFIWDIFNLLTQKWAYFPTDEDLDICSAFFQQYYGEESVELFKNIVHYQKVGNQYALELSENAQIQDQSIIDFDNISTKILIKKSIYRIVRRALGHSITEKLKSLYFKLKK